MKNKLLLSSALVGGLIASGNSFAQTSVSGNMSINYKAQSQKVASGATAKSERFFGRETQINIANKGKLNNGMDYVMGFSLEYDGDMTTDSRDSSISNENVYIDFISGDTTVTVGLDHIQNVTQTVLPVIYNHYDILAGMGATATNAVGAGTKESIGAGVIQKIPSAGLTLSALWVPQSGFTGTGNDVVNKSDAATTSPSTADRNSSYEIGVRGADTFGVKGLAVSAFMNNEKGSTPGTLSTNNDVTGYHVGASYGVGNFRLGAEKNSNQANTGHANTVKSYAISYAATQNATLGVWRADSKIGLKSASATVDEKAYGFGVGYNFGPLAVMVDHTRLDNQDGVSGADVREVSLKFLAAF
jgi:hypothetical protein